ncbi:hypothetical protein JCM11491_000945 [Sporobolomyces phaffii]
MSRPAPSVLLAASNAPPRGSGHLALASPVASTSSIPYSNEPTLHCSQCQKDRPVSDFPVRLINLRPYLVCLSHDWYWTDAKRASHWAPEHTSSLREACDAFATIARDGGEYEDRFMLDGDESDLKRIVDSLARAGDWKTKKITPRKSRAKTSHHESPPTTTFIYGFRERADPKVVNRFTLTMYLHRTERKFTMTFKPEGKKDRSDGAWARPNRCKFKLVQTVEVEQGRDERRLPPRPPSSSIAETSLGPEAADGASSADSALSRAQRDAQQMPPPPIPPRKKARRVEPSLVSSTLLRAAPSSTTLADYPQESLVLSGPPAQLQQHAWPLDGPVPPLPTPPRYPAHGPPRNSDPTLSSFADPYSTSNRLLSTDSLTLFEMLANPAFDPPIIPLLPRPQRPAPATRRDMTPQTQRTPAAAGKELDDAVADALGGRRRNHRRGTKSRRGESLEDEEELGDGGGHEIGVIGNGNSDDSGSNAGDEGDYEDSIPDDSSQEDEQSPEGRVDDDDDDVSSFFESSAEEYSDFGESGDEGEGDEEEEDEDEEDWLAGFVSKQMPGMVVNVGEETATTTATRGRLREEAIRSTRLKTVRQSNLNPREQARQTERPIAGEEDEVDELDSSGEE